MMFSCRKICIHQLNQFNAKVMMGATNLFQINRNTRCNYSNIPDLFIGYQMGISTAIGMLLLKELVVPPTLTDAILVKRAIVKPLQQTQLTPFNSYVPISGVEKGLQLAMLHDVCGIHLLSMPPASGKTTTVKRVATDLVLNAKLCGALYIDMNADNNHNHNTFSAKIAEHLAISHSKLYSILDEVVPKCLENTTKHIKAPLVIIIDNVDNIILTNDSFRYDLVSLATQSINDKTFVLVLIFQNDDIARLVCKWNGDTKIHQIQFNDDSPFSLQPTHNELMLAVTAQNLNLSPKLAANYLELCVASKSIGFIANAAAIIRGHQCLESPIQSSEKINNMLQNQHETNY